MRDYHPKRKFSSSSIPSAAALQAYEDMSEGAADKILTMAQSEQIHRHKWEYIALHKALFNHRLGQIFAFLIALSIVLGTIYLSITKDYISASALAITGFMSLSLSSLAATKTLKKDLNIRNFTRQRKRVKNSKN